MLGRQERDLAKMITADPRLVLAAGPYLQGAGLIDTLLHLTFRRACFADADAPRTREAFELAVDQGRARLHSGLAEVIAAALGWFTQARAVRRVLEDRRAQVLGDAAEESHAHLQRLLGEGAIVSMSADWLRQLPRYLKAQERRWQRSLARGGESAHVTRDLRDWSARYQALEDQLDAELRWIPELEELRCWIEEYRVSLYAQELKTLGPISAARLTQRAADIDTWIRR